MGLPNSLRYFLFGAKELGNEWLKGLLEVDRGIMDMPVTIRKIHQKMDSRRLLELGVRSQETSHVSAGSSSLFMGVQKNNKLSKKP